MQSEYEYKITVNLDNLGYLKVVANISEKHDRSAPTNFHWKILKCRMLIFSESSILACPDQSDVKQINVIFNKIGCSYDILTSLFLKYSLSEDGSVEKVTKEMYLSCFKYTLSAKLAPTWNILGYNYFINNRNFLTRVGPQAGIKYSLSMNNNKMLMNLKPVKITLVKSREDFLPGEPVRVLPSLNQALIDASFSTLPKDGSFKSYKDLRRHWKNIHGYRLPEEEYPYCSVRFWRGEPLTYPVICLSKTYPIIIPVPKTDEKRILTNFMNCLKTNMSQVLESPLIIESSSEEIPQNIEDTQAVSLCTPTQR